MFGFAFSWVIIYRSIPEVAPKDRLQKGYKYRLQKASGDSLI